MDCDDAGTVVTRGRAAVTVTATGRSTALGGIATSLRGTSVALTPLQRQLALLGRRLAIGVAIAALAVVILNLAAGRSIEISLVLGISLAVAAIPESLPRWSPCRSLWLLIAWQPAVCWFAGSALTSKGFRS